MWTRFGRRRISDVKTESVSTRGRAFIKGKKIQVDTEEGHRYASPLLVATVWQTNVIRRQNHTRTAPVRFSP